MKKGVLITIFVLIIIVLLLALAAGFIYLQVTREPYIPSAAYLKIDLQGEIVDHDTSLFSHKNNIRDIWYHIQRAKIDSRILGIVLKISYLETGLGKIDDIGRLLADFRKSGKPVYAYIDNGGLKEYYLATFADKVYAAKGGGLSINGLAAEALFIKNTLDMLGIKAEFFHIGEYKTAAHMLTQERLTDAHRESLQTLLNDLYESTLERIAANRGLDKEMIRNQIENFSFSGEPYLRARMIDQLLYEDEMYKQHHIDDRLVDFDTYSETSGPYPYRGRDRIAVIFAAGEIYPGQSGKNSLFGGETLGADTLVQQLESVRENPSVKAVVLRVDSPGGSPFASEAIHREIQLLVREKPLVISMSDLAASGGYFLSLSASKIIALPQTLTGSIGVVGGKFVLKDLYDKFGIKKEIVKTAPFADMFSDYRLFSPVEREKYQGYMLTIYDSFVQKVAAGRKLPLAEVEQVARGRVWAGSSALGLKLVDRLGGLLDAIAEARQLAHIPPEVGIGIILYPHKKSLLQTVQEFMGMSASATLNLDYIEKQLRLYQKIFPAMVMPFRLRFN